MKLVLGIVVSALISYVVLSAQELRIYQIDVDQGDAALIVSPTGKYVLVDAGYDRYDQGNYGDTVLNFLRSLGITHLDYVIASHYHQDHIGGLPRVIYGLSGWNSNDSILGWCYDRGDTYTTSSFINYRNAVANKRRTVVLGETINLGGGAFIYCIAKNGKLINGDSVLPNTGENYKSLVWILEYGYFRFFTGGDLVGANVPDERDVETKVARIAGRVELLKANHHGGRNSSNAIFLDSLSPQAVIISQGVYPVNNSHPHQEAIDRYVARNIYIYQMNNNPSGGVFPSNAGKILNTTATVTVNRYEFVINGDTYPIRQAQRDIVVADILVPQETIPAGINVCPKVKIKNLGNIPENIVINFKIGNVYNRQKNINDLRPNDSIIVTFDSSWRSIRGVFNVSCSVGVKYDLNPSNNVKRLNLVVRSGWIRRKAVPVPVKCGGCLVATDSQLYAFTGNNTVWFYQYNPELDSWFQKRDIPLGYFNGQLKNKKVRSGASLAFGEDSLARKVIYALKGNNTPEFWKYDIATDSWIQLSNVQIGGYLYPIKQGSSLCYSSTDSKYVFLLIGSSKRRDFLAYNVVKNHWKRESNLPDSNFKAGSCMTIVRDSIFVLKGKGRTNSFYMYDIRNNTWYQRESLPSVHPYVGRGRKVNAGASLTFNVLTNKLYAFKGGRTQEFWEYDISSNRWQALETIPRATSGVADGGALATCNGLVYGLKGNKTQEFWCYVPELNCFDSSSPQTNNFESKSNKISENSPVKIYSADGRLIKAIKSPPMMSKYSIPSGVYFIIHFSDGNITRTKFIRFH
ncbi:MAG: MBL fold metallo-hydrolase [candidate division WOR-3 bacterium]